MLLAGFGTSFSIFVREDRQNETTKEGEILRKALENVLGVGLIVRLFTMDYPWVESLVSSILGVNKIVKTVSDSLDNIIEERKKIFENDPERADELNDLISLMIKANIQNKVLTNDEIKSNGMYYNL